MIKTMIQLKRGCFWVVETIKKRNGVVVAFDAQKIYNAIFKANIRIADEKLTEQQLNALTKEIVSTFPNNTRCSYR